METALQLPDQFGLVTWARVRIAAIRKSPRMATLAERKNLLKAIATYETPMIEFSQKKLDEAMAIIDRYRYGTGEGGAQAAPRAQANAKVEVPELTWNSTTAQGLYRLWSPLGVTDIEYEPGVGVVIVFADGLRRQTGSAAASAKLAKLEVASR